MGSFARSPAGVALLMRVVNMLFLHRQGTVKRLALVPALVLLAAGCGLTEPENILRVNGTVVAASAGAGYTAGQAVDGAEVTLRYTPPLQSSSIVRDSDATNASGEFSVRTGPPSGQIEPNCSTLNISVVKAGFQTAMLRLSGLCEGAGELNDVVIQFTPN